MEPLTVKNSLGKKLHQTVRILARHGPTGLYKVIRSYLIYQLRDKWKFKYLGFSLEQTITPFKTKEPVTVRVATPQDLGRIEAELFPFMHGEMDYEKRYFRLLGQSGVTCFLAERGGSFIHYSWVFLDAFKSPLLDVPFDKDKLRPGDSYVGPIYTVPSARGLVYLEVLPAILSYLKHDIKARRVIVFVAGNNASGASFYERIGFREIPDAVRANWLYALRQKVTATIP